MTVSKGGKFKLNKISSTSLGLIGLQWHESSILSGIEACKIIQPYSVCTFLFCYLKKNLTHQNALAVAPHP